MMKGNLPEAVKALEACVGAKPDFSEAWNNLGTAYQESNRKDKAEEAFAKAFALDQNYNASYNLARMAYEKPDYPTALDLVRKSIEKYPRSILAFNLQGLVLENLERYDEALDSYQQALRLSPGELNVQFNIAAVYYKKKNYDLSRDLLQRILPQAKNAELRSRIEELLKRLAR
jgi:tetratricopeptide (TPR) repeat protein